MSLNALPGGQPPRKPAARSESQKVVAIRSNDNGPTPGGAQGQRPQLVERTAAVSRFNSMLPQTRDQFIYAYRKRLSDLAREFQIPFNSGLGIVLDDLQKRAMRELRKAA